MTDDIQRTPQQVWHELMAGNDRFATGRCEHPHRDEARRQQLVAGQRPKAVVLGCGDSRVPAEIIFDAGLGDLFVVRNAGAVLGTSILGSIEFAVGALHVPLVMVLGHESCGAVAGAIAAADPDQPAPEGFYLEELLRRIRPAVDQARLDGDPSPDHIGRLHTERTIKGILGRSGLVAAAVTRGETAVVGCSYRLGSGRVEPVAARGVDVSDLPGVTDAVPLAR